MRNYRLFAGLLALLILVSGCNTAYLQYRRGVVISHRTVITDGVSRPSWNRSNQKINTYIDNYDNSRGVVATTSTEIWIGTTIVLGGVYCYWCDFCHIWHPRCYANHCYCAPIVRNHYGFYVFDHYMYHCFNWAYEPIYVPVVSKYRFKNNGRYISYEVERKKREFQRNGLGNAANERVRYRGKEENRYTFKPETVKKSGDLEKTRSPLQKDSGNVNKPENRRRTVTKDTQTKKNPGIESRNGRSNSREAARTGTQAKERNTERRPVTVEKGSSTGNRTARVEKNKNRRNNGSSFLSRIGSILSKTKSRSRGTSTKTETRSGGKSKNSGGSSKAKQPVKKNTPKRKVVKKKN